MRGTTESDDEFRIPVKLMILDLDNTLYNWVDYFAPAFRAMVHILSDQTGIPEETLTNDFSSVYLKYGSTEYPFSVQKLASLEHFPEALIENLAQQAFRAFSRSRVKRMRPYPGVPSTLHWAQKSGIRIAILTSAPGSNVNGKIRQLGILNYIDAIVSAPFFLPDDPATISRIKGHDLTRGTESEELLAVVAPRGSTKNQLERLAVQFDRAEVKAQGMTYLAKHFELDLKDCVMVGDSIHSDVQTATELGVKAIWARYGLHFANKNRETIEKLTPGGSQAVRSAYSRDGLPESAIPIDSFDEIQNIICGDQLSLF